MEVFAKILYDKYIPLADCCYMDQFLGRNLATIKILHALLMFCLKKSVVKNTSLVDNEDTSSEVLLQPHPLLPECHDQDAIRLLYTYMALTVKEKLISLKNILSGLVEGCEKDNETVGLQSFYAPYLGKGNIYTLLGDFISAGKYTIALINRLQLAWLGDSDLSPDDTGKYLPVIVHRESGETEEVTAAENLSAAGLKVLSFDIDGKSNRGVFATKCAATGDKPTFLQIPYGVELDPRYIKVLGEWESELHQLGRQDVVYRLKAEVIAHPATKVFFGRDEAGRIGLGYLLNHAPSKPKDGSFDPALAYSNVATYSVRHDDGLGVDVLYLCFKLSPNQTGQILHDYGSEWFKDRGVKPCCFRSDTGLPVPAKAAVAPKTSLSGCFGSVLGSIRQPVQGGVTGDDSSSNLEQRGSAPTP